MKTKFIAFLHILAFSFNAVETTSAAATLTIDWKNVPGYELKNQSGAFLTGGVLNRGGDGAALELGYYSLSTTASPFLGEWIAFTGKSSPDPIWHITTIGDKGAGGDGLFDIRSQFNSEFDPFVIGGVGHPLTIRFYNQVVSISPTFFNAVSSPDWVLQPFSDDSPLLMTIDLSSAGNLLWQGGQANNQVFRTIIPIPEPSGFLLLGLSSLRLFFRRRNQGHT